MSNYICQHTFGSLIKATFAIYGRHFVTIFLVAALPLVLLNFGQNVLIIQGKNVLAVLSNILLLPIFTLILAALTMAVSNICLGNKPSLIVSYKYILSSAVAKLLVTNLLQVLAMCIGIILVIIPGLIVAVWLFFVPIIVIMENTWGLAALKRSKALGKGNYWRIFFLWLVMVLIGSGIGGLLGGIYGLLSVFVPVMSGIWGFALFQSLIQALIFPLSFIMLILFYYDLRVRKEAYDITTLSENINL